MRTSRSRLSSAAVAVLVVAFVLSGAIVAGAHDGGPGGGVIHACVHDRTGELEIVDANDHCGPNASPLDWKAKGRQGEQGNPGPIGPPGPGFEELTVATATGAFIQGADGAAGNGPVATVGVDCPGDSIATGGGGIASGSNSISISSDQGTTSVLGHLDSSVPLEQNSTSNTAEPGDTPTGWRVSGTPPVTVYAICADPGEDPGPDDDAP